MIFKNLDMVLNTINCLDKANNILAYAIIPLEEGYELNIDYEE